MQIGQVNDWVAEVTGLDCAGCSAADLPALRQAFRDNHVLVFRDQQRLDPTQLATFSRTLGELERPLASKYRHPDTDDVLILSNEVRPDGTAVGLVDGGQGWHSDSSHGQRPAKATLLHAIRNPAVGGDTEYCNMHAVYDGLPEDLKKQITGRHGVHDANKLINPRAAVSANRPGAREDYQRLARERPSVRQPLVRTHPETGRPSLYISPRFTVAIDEIDDVEAQPLLDTLFNFADDPRYHYRHQWSDGDLVMWDNRCLNHRATGGIPDGQIRRMHRTVLCGDEAYYDPDGRPRESAHQPLAQ